MDLGNACAGVSGDAIKELQEIAEVHEQANGLFMKLVDLVGSGTEAVIAGLPSDWQARISDASEAALNKAYDLAIQSQGNRDEKTIYQKALSWAEGERWHKISAGVTGALGGLGGLPTTFIDLPVTTTLILRSIQQIAAQHGEDLSDPIVRAQCIAVFGLGGPTKSDDGTDAGLWAARLALSHKAIGDMMKAVLPKFGLVVSQKTIAQFAPLVGSVAGATINPIFTGYYQKMAHVHFRLRKLERDFDPDQIGACFERVLSERARRAEAAQLETKARLMSMSMTKPKKETNTSRG